MNSNTDYQKTVLSKLPTKAQGWYLLEDSTPQGFHYVCEPEQTLCGLGFTIDPNKDIAPQEPDEENRCSRCNSLLTTSNKQHKRSSWRRSLPAQWQKAVKESGISDK